MSEGLDHIDLNSGVVNGGVDGVNTPESTVGLGDPLRLDRDSRISEGLGSVEKSNGKEEDMGHLRREDDEKLAGMAFRGQIGVNDNDNDNAIVLLGLNSNFQNTDTYRGASTCSEKNNEGLENYSSVFSGETVVDRCGESVSGRNEVEGEVAAVSGSQHVEMKPTMGDGGAGQSDPIKPDQVVGESLNLLRADGEWESDRGIKNEGTEVKGDTGVLLRLVDDAAPPVDGVASNGNQSVVNEVRKKDTQQVEDIKIEIVKQESRANECQSEKGGQFHASDLVWGKVRSHPWWPGQILDPSEASEKARRYSKKDGFLIAYFGDKTFAWNEARLIKPFKMHFSQMQKQTTTEAFSHALDCALEEVSRRVEFGLACSCLSADVRDKLKTQIVINAGIHKDSSRRASGDESSSAACFMPANLVKNVKAVAQCPYGGIDRLEFVTARAQLLAVSRWKGFYCLPQFEMLGGSLEDGAAIPVTGKRKFTEDLVCVNEQFPLRKGKSGIQDASRKRKNLSLDDVFSSKKERCLSDLMSRSCSNLSNGEGEPEVKVGSKVEKRKALDSVPDNSGRENKKVSLSTEKQFSRVGESIRRVANQLAMSSPNVKNGSAIHKAKNRSDKRSSRSNSEKSQRRKVIPEEYPLPDEMLSKIYNASRDPLKGYNFLASSLNYLTRFRNSCCMEKSTSREGRNLTRKVSSKKGGEKLHDLGSTETSGLEGTEDSYWTDMIVQSSTDEQVLFEPEILKENGGMTVVTEATLESGQGSDSKQETDVINHESGGKSEGCMDEKCEEDHTPTAFILNFADLESVPSQSNLNNIFSRYGPLIESDTEVLKKSKRAKVVFKRRADAETAFSSSGKFSTFGPSLVSYRLNYLPSTPRKTSASATKRRSKKDAASVEGNGA